MKRRGFTLIEVLIVVGIIGVLVAILLPAVSKSREWARRVSCSSNLQQIAKGLQCYTQDYSGQYPLAWKTQYWETQQDGPGWDDKMGWMRRVFGYLKDRNVFKCPSFKRAEDEFHYFLGTRAAYARNRKKGFQIEYSRVTVRVDLIEYPSILVLGGDCNRKFDIWDCDRDDYTQPCLGWKDEVQNENGPFWFPWHSEGLNVIFADAHAKWYQGHVGNDMTYSYDEYTDWFGAFPNPPDGT